MRQIDKFIIHISHNLFPLNEYSEGELKKLMAQFKEEADDLGINITDTQLKAYIERFDALKNSPKVTEKDLRKYTLSKLIKLVSSSKGAEVPEEVDETPDIVYNENGIVIYNGSNEENCLNFGRGEKWCITRGSFGSYRYDANKKNPTFYLVKDTNLNDNDRKSFFVVVVGSDNTYKVSDRSNNDVGGRQTEWNRWEPWSFVEREFPSIRGLQRVFKYIPLSSSEKLNQNYKITPVDIRTFTKFPYSVKEQYLVIRKGKELFSDIKTDEFIEKYLPKYPQLATFISVNAGIIPSVTLVKYLDKFSNQDTRSIISNMRDKLPLSNLSSDAIPFNIKKFLIKFDKWEIKPDERIYITKDGNAIVKLDIDNDIKVGVYTEEDDYPNVKLNKRTSKFLLDYPELDKIPFKNLLDLSSEGIIDKSVVDGVLEKAKTDPNSAIIIKDTENGQILLDSNSFSSYRIKGDSITKIPFNSEEVQKIFAGEKDNDSFQEGALNLFKNPNNLPSSVDKEVLSNIIKSIPFDKRVINSDDILLTAEGPTPFFTMKINPSRYDLFLRTNRTYSSEGTVSSSEYITLPIIQSYFTYLRQTNQTISDSQLLGIMRAYGAGNQKKYFIQSNPPIGTSSSYKPVMNGDQAVIVNIQNPSQSFKISDTTGKLLNANISASLASRLLGTTPAGQVAVGQAATPTSRRGRPAGVPNTPRPATQPVPTQAGGAGSTMDEILVPLNLSNSYRNLPRSARLRLSGIATRVQGVSRGASRRNNMLNGRGTVTATYEIGGSSIYIIRLQNGTNISSINIQPGNGNYLLLPNGPISLSSPSELMAVLAAQNLAEVRNYIIREYLENNPTHRDEVYNLIKRHVSENKKH